MSKTLCEIAVARSGEGMFLVNEQGQLVLYNPRLCQILGMVEEQLADRDHQVVIAKLAALSHDPHHTRLELDKAIHSVQARPGEQRTLPIPNRRLQLTFFSTQPDFNGWGCAIRHDVPDPAESTPWARYLAAAFHELHTPFSSVKGQLDMLVDSHQYWAEETRHDFLLDIQRGLSAVNKVVEYGEQIAALGLGASRANYRLTDIAACVQHAIGSLVTDVPIRVAAPAERPCAEVDPARLEQIVYHMVGFMLGAAPSGGQVSVEIALEAEALTLTAASGGSRLSHHSLAEMFERFGRMGQVEGERITPQEMMLFVAYQAALAHGGYLFAEQDAARGVLLACSLPTAPALARLDGLPRALARSRVKQPSHGGQAGVILVVDDDPQSVQLMKLALESKSYRVVVASSGAEALEMVTTKKLDAVLLDIYLPDMSGLEVCAKLRELSTVPIIIVSVNIRSEDAAHALDLGADDYITKPFGRAELLARIRAILRRVSRAQAAPGAGMFTLKDLQIDFARRQVTVRGLPVRLARIQYRLLYTLVTNAGRVLSREQLLTTLWGPEYQNASQYLWVQISRLRRKLEKNPANPEYILTASGEGYYVPAPGESMNGSSPLAAHD